MAIVVVGGHSRNIGKTSVVAGLIRALPQMRWTALKITQYGHGFCTADGAACDCQTDDHTLAVSAEKTARDGGDPTTDSGRYLVAGAVRSLWIRTRIGMLADAMPRIRKELAASHNVIIESNSILKFLQPDLYLSVLDPATADFKDSARLFLDRADAIISIERDLAPQWQNVSQQLLAGKPRFLVVPPAYLSDELIAFVKSRIEELDALEALGSGKRRDRMPNEQLWSAEDYQKEGSFVPLLGAGVLELLDPKQGERILDLGCGDGILSRKLLEAGAMVIGIDNSPSMVDAARAKGIDARQGNAERLPELFATDAATGSPARFDAVFSNAALHWVRDQDAMLRGVARVLRPGGRFVFEMGGHGNIAAVRTALRAAVQSVNPLKAKLLLAGEYSENYFPTAAGYSARLQRHGFTVHHAELIARPTVLGPGGIRGWYRTFRNGILSALTEQEKEQVLVYAEDLLKAALFDEDGTWIADYVRLRVSAQLQ